MFKVEVDNIINLEERFKQLFSVENLVIRTVKIAQEAGVILLNSAVQNCIDAVYGATNATTDLEHEYERTLALLDSHIVEDKELEQFIGIDPSAIAVDPHSGREMVIDYAIPVHEGYTQFVFGKDTGVFHPGRKWFDNTLAETSPVLVQFIEKAFEQIIIESLTEVFF